MAEKAYYLTQKAKDQLDKLLHSGSLEATQTVGKPNGLQVIQAHLTDYDSDLKAHAWIQARQNEDVEWEEITNGLHGEVDSLPALDPSDSGDLSDTYVSMARGTYLNSTGDVKPCFMILKGGALPPGTGRYKLLQLIDDLDPGTANWDFVRSHS